MGVGAGRVLALADPSGEAEGTNEGPRVDGGTGGDVATAEEGSGGDAANAEEGAWDGFDGPHDAATRASAMRMAALRVVIREIVGRRSLRDACGARDAHDAHDAHDARRARARARATIVE
ncbi:MAG: hypothetical protein HYX54_08610 [Chloroflexi bacterium]|nr:hypothetical protein [Chloroflexota bacterium]